jgi:isocitrate dehydrogenase
MERDKLRAFVAEEIEDARKKGILFSVHLKATMMKVSDPIIFGHVVEMYFSELFNKYRETFATLKISPNNGLRDLYERITVLPKEQQEEILRDIRLRFEEGPGVSMVDSDRGITSFDVPSDFIIDSTIPSAIRSSGKTWGPEGTLRDTKLVVPDRSYATLYQEAIDFCRINGAFDPASMGSVSNIGLMARKAEEYGSHDKTFEMENEGTVKVVDAAGTVLLEQKVGKGDVFRMCQVKDAPVQDWVGLCVSRARETGSPAIFWLDEERAHDRNIIEKAKKYLAEHDTKGLDIRIMKPAEAMRFTLERLKKGLDTISVTGNVLRDYLTDLFPILELGTSAKMLSIVRLLNGGGLFETGAAGSAPKHVQQFENEGHLRWDSLGEYLALTVSLEHFAKSSSTPAAQVLADTLDKAIGQLLENGKSPARKSGELDTRGSHYYLALYWAKALADQNKDSTLQAHFAALADKLGTAESKIIAELKAAQGHPVDIGGYFHPDKDLSEKAMRASTTFNGIIDPV